MIGLLILAATCDPAGEPTRTTADERRDVYAIVRSTCKEQGVSDHVCSAALAKAWRESRGVATATHTRGHNEYGLGLFGHAPKFWGWLLRPTEIGPDAFCDPRLATVALFREYQFAVRRGARNLRDLQRVHSGRSPRDASRPERDNRWCYLLEHGPRDDQGVVSWSATDCEQRVTAGDLGPRLDDERVAEIGRGA